MLKKGLIVILMTVTLGILSGRVNATAPTVSDPGDFIIGDLENGAASNDFNFPDAFDLNAIASDDNTPDNLLIWSFSAADNNILVNGVLPLQGGENAVTPPLARRLDQNDLDTGNPKSGGGFQDADPYTVTLRNANLSPLPDSPPYGAPVGGPGILAAETRTITLNATDEGGLTGTRSIVVYTSDDSSDSLSGNSLTNLFDFDFLSDPTKMTGWWGGTFSSIGTTGTGTGTPTPGLCVWCPLGSDPSGIYVWLSPPNFVNGPGYITVTAGNAYRVRLRMYTDQTADSAIPLWVLDYHNQYLAINDGNVFGGEIWALDVAGGATGIGRFQSDFDFYCACNAEMTEQWLGTLPGGNPDNANSAYDPSVDFKNDINLQLKILHDDTNVNTAGDGGKICLKGLRVDRIDLSTLGLTSIYTKPIKQHTTGGGNHYVKPDDFPGGSGGGTRVFDDVNGWVTFTLNGNYNADKNGSRKSLRVWDESLVSGSDTNFNQQLNPIIWQDHHCYLTKSKIRSNVGGRNGTTEGTDPYDLLQMSYESPTSEAGCYMWSDKGSPGNFNHATSPRLIATTGGSPQEYFAMLDGWVASKADSISGQPLGVNNARLRGLAEFWNTGTTPYPALGTATDGKDGFAAESLDIFDVDKTGWN